MLRQLLLVTCLFSVGIVNGQELDTAYCYKNRFKAGVTFRNYTISKPLEWYKQVGSNSMYLDEMLEENASDHAFSTSYMEYELGFEHLFDWRKEKQWFPFINLGGSISAGSILSEFDLSDSSEVVVDTLYDSNGNSYVLKDKDYLSHSLRFTNSMVGISADIKAYLWRGKRYQVATYIGCQFSALFGRKSTFDVDRRALGYRVLDDAYYVNYDQSISEETKAQRFGVLYISPNLGIDISNFSFSYQTSFVASNRFVLPQGYLLHSFRLSMWFGRGEQKIFPMKPVQ